MLPVTELKSFLADNCIKCHGQEKVKGDLNFKRISIDLQHREVHEIWSEIYSSIKFDEMPPEDEPRPDSGQKEAFMEVLQKHLDQAESSLPPKIEPATVELKQNKEAKSKKVVATVERFTLKPFMTKYCYECHGEKKQKGDLRLDTIDWNISDANEAQHWQDVLDALNSGDMPPEEASKPNKKALIDTISSLTDTLGEAEERLSDVAGVYTMRRINTREYINTIKHLFGVNITSQGIPVDSGAEGYDTIGKNQFFTQSNITEYNTIAQKIINESTKWITKEHSKPTLFKANLRRAIGNKGIHYDRYTKLYGNTSGHFLTGILQRMDHVSVDQEMDPRADYKLRITVGADPDTLPSRHYIRVDKNEFQQVYHVNGTLENPETIEIDLKGELLSLDRNELRISENIAATNDRHLKLLGEKKLRASIWVKEVTIEGPFYNDQVSFFGELLKKYGDLTPRNLDNLLSEFAFEAFRRKKPSRPYINALKNHYAKLIELGDTSPEALAKTLAVILTSPKFVYLEEDLKPNQNFLSPESYANRLSYFLWSSPPDDELYRVAASGGIYKPKIHREQVIRMLRDKRSEVFYEGFISQWAEFDRFDSISVSASDYPEFNQGVRKSAKLEVIEFFKYLTQNNRPLSDLLDSDYAVVNKHLADYYGFEGDFSNDFERYQLPPDSPRGGMVGQAAFLISGSNGIRSSPVIRGMLVLDKLLDDPPPPAPPNVPELGVDVVEPLSNRDMVLLHQNRAACSSCHKRMDPIGFSLENFDTIGKWRTKEMVGSKNVTIDNSVKTPAGETFKGVDGLKEHLMSHEGDFARGFIKNLLEYGTGRPMSFSDKKSVEALLKKAKGNDYLAGEIIIDILRSDIFVKK